jgi:hypothetical protein
MALKTPKEQALTDLAIHYSTDMIGVESIIYDPAGDNISATAIMDTGAGDPREGADAFDVTARLRIRVSEVATVAVHKTITLLADDEGDNETYEVIYANKTADGLEWLVDVHKQ